MKKDNQLSVRQGEGGARDKDKGKTGGEFPLTNSKKRLVRG